MSTASKVDSDKIKAGVDAITEKIKATNVLKYPLILFVLLYLFFVAFFVYVKPNEVGILEVKFNVIPFMRDSRGIQEKPLDTGLRFVIPFVEKVHILPKDIQVFDLTNFPTHYTKGHRPAEAAHIQTSDGFYVDVDVSILYRISDPYLTFTEIGPGVLYETNGIEPNAEPILKIALGELTTEEFYNSPIRFEKAELAREMLNENLNPKGITVEHVLVRYFVYSDEIQRNIEEKKLMDQLFFTRKSEAKAAAELANVKKIIEEGEAEVTVKLEEGNAYVVMKNAEAEEYVRKRKAEADLLVELAEAEKQRLLNDALLGSGSKNIVGLEMAKVYQGLDVIIIPSDGPSGINPLDLDETLELFEVR